MKNNLVIGKPVVYENENVLNEKFISNVFSNEELRPRPDFAQMNLGMTSFLEIQNAFRSYRPRFIPMKYFDTESSILKDIIDKTISK